MSDNVAEAEAADSSSHHPSNTPRPATASTLRAAAGDLLFATSHHSPSSNRTADNSLAQPISRFVASDYRNDGKFHLLLAASGSVATIKIPNIIEALTGPADKTASVSSKAAFLGHKPISIRLILTDSAANFLQGQSSEQPALPQILARCPEVEAVYRDSDEWAIPWTRNAPILHIELRRWADLLVIAPLSANTLAKISHGLCDNLLTSVVRAWEVEPVALASAVGAGAAAKSEGDQPASPPTTAGQPSPQKQIIVAPAMNTYMWRHPLTQQQLKGTIQQWHWFDILSPIEKELACGDTGDGAMCDWRDIVKTIISRTGY